MPLKYDPFPLIGDVLVDCPECKRKVWCRRMVYRDIATYSCHGHHHHWEIPVTPGVPIPGDSNYWAPGKGLDEDDDNTDTGEHRHTKGKR